MQGQSFSRIIAKFFSLFLLVSGFALLAGCSPGTTPTAASGTPGATAAAAPTIAIALSTTAIGPGVNATVTATLKDSTGAGITGAVIAFSANSTYGTLSPVSALTVNGVATATLSAANGAPSGADSVAVTVQSVPTSAAVSSTAIGLSASTGYAVGGAVAPTVGSVTVTSSAASLTADGSSAATISATVKDTTGAVIPGATVTFHTNNAGSSLSATTANTNASGIAQVTLTAPTSTKNSATVTASSGGSSNSVNITFLPGAPSNIALTLTPTATSPAGVVTVAANVTDQYGNVVATGTTVNFASSTGGLGSSTGGTFTAASAVTNVIGNASTSYIAGSCTVATCTDILTVTSGTGALNTINLTINSSNSSVAGVSVTAGNTSITADGASYTAINAAVKNSSGVGVQGVGVAFTATAGRLSSTAPPTITPATTTATDSFGTATLYLIAPTTTGNATVTAATSGYSNSVPITFVPGPPATIGLNAKPATVQPGNTLQLTAVALDAQGNPVGANQTINFAEAAATNTTGGSFSTASGLTNANGIVNVTYTAGACALASCTAALKASATNALVTSSTNVTVSGAAIVVGNLAIAATNSSIQVTGGTTTNTIINAAVTDTSGNPIPGATVNFTTTAGTLSGMTVTNGSGIASATLTSGNTVMTAVVSASISGFLSSTNVSFTAGAPATISLNAAPNAVKPGGASTITASVKDSAGNPVVGQSVAFSFTLQGSGLPTLSATSATTDVNGLATVNYTAGAGAGTDTITAITSNGKTPGAPASITVSNSSVAVKTISTSASIGSIPVTTGTSIIRTTVLDTAGSPIQGITVTFTPSAGTVSPATAVTDASGTAQTTLTAGAQLLTATVSGSAGGFTSSTAVVFTAGTANTVTVSAAPTTLNPGGSSTVYAYLTDSSSNPVSGDTVSFAITTKGSGQPTLSNTTAVTNVNGIASVTYTAGTTGGTTDTVQATTSTAKTGTVTVTVNATVSAVVGGLKLAAGAASLPTGGATTAIIATVTDTAGAPMAGVTVSFLSSAGTLSPASASTNSSGVAQATLTSSSNLGMATITANASGFSTTTSVNFVASNPNAINLNASPATVSSAANSNLRATVIDAQGNPAAGQTVTFSITANSSGGTLNAVTAVTDANGNASTAYTAGAGTGTDKITATTTNGLNTTTSITVTAGTTPTAASLTLAATPASVKTDNSSPATVTVTALSSTNAVIPNVVVTLGADTGVLGSASVTTGTNGQATFTFNSGVTTKFNRTASITATAGSTLQTLPVPITGSTLTMTTATSGAVTTLAATAKDAGGNPASGQTVSFTITGGSGALSAATATTNTSGVATVNFTTSATGTASVRADWLNSPGTTSTASVTNTFAVSTSGGVFSLLIPASSPSAVTLGATQAVTVQVPTTILTASDVAKVRFSTSLGTWQSNGANTQTVPFTTAGTYTQTFVAGANAGNANVQIDALDLNGAVLSSAQAVLSLSASAASASTISLQANVTSISPSTGSSSSTAALTAMVRDANGNPVGNAPVLFQLLNPSGSGEQVTPVTVMTAATAANGQAVGQALSTYIAGTLPTTQASQIQASVIGSSPLVSSITTITVGGTAGSIAIGTSTTIASVNSNTAYQLPVTLLVTDSNGNAVSGATVSLSLWATEYAKGVRNSTCGPAYAPGPLADGGFPNEDTNENLILDAGEDVDGPGAGLVVSVSSATPPVTTVTCGPNNTGPTSGNCFGAPDGVLWPPSSAAGSVPQTVTTGSDGTASFNLTYLKDYASWLKIRLRARTTVQGTETTSVYSTVLPISQADAVAPCTLSNSPFN